MASGAEQIESLFPFALLLITPEKRLNSIPSQAPLHNSFSRWVCAVLIVSLKYLDTLKTLTQSSQAEKKTVVNPGYCF